MQTKNKQITGGSPTLWIKKCVQQYPWPNGLHPQAIYNQWYWDSLLGNDWQWVSIGSANVLMSNTWLASTLLGSWTSYQIHKIAGCACAGNAGNVFPRRRFQRKLLVSDPGMHHGTCVRHVPWCMSGSLTCSDGENVPGIPGACASAILRIWQEAHWWQTMALHICVPRQSQ